MIITFKTAGNRINTAKKNMIVIYHRTRLRGVRTIAQKGISLKPGNRRESGPGLYCLASLGEANQPYPKKTYGNFILRITADITPEETDKITAMEATKAGNYGDRMYDIPYLGNVIVLYSIEKITSIEVSQDNGKSWKSLNDYK